MNFNLSPRLKSSLIISAFFLTAITVTIIYTGAFGFRNYSPEKPGTDIIINGAAKEPETDPVGPVPVKVNSNPNPRAITSGIVSLNLLFEATKSDAFEDDDAHFLETDFIDQLNTVPERTGKFVGIGNRKNSCYANSVIQMLFRITDIRKIIANLGIYQRRLESRKNHMNSGALADIKKAFSVVEGLNHMFYQLQTNKNDPATFEYGKSIQCLPGNYVDNRQEDADEYLTEIIDALKEILPKSQHHRLILTVSLNGILTSISDPSLSEPRQKIDFENRISLPLNSATFDNLLNSYFGTETVALNLNDWTPGQLVRTKRLENLPEIITIHLQRLTADNNSRDSNGIASIIKNEKPLTLPDEIDFANYIREGLDSHNTKYKLKMFVKHSGSAKGGHYYAYSRNNLRPDSWYCLNDSRVTLDKNRADFKKDKDTGYLYFYERINK